MAAVFPGFSSAEVAYLRGETVAPPTVEASSSSKGLHLQAGAVPIAHGSALAEDAENRVLIAITADDASDKCKEDLEQKLLAHLQERVRGGAGRGNKGISGSSESKKTSTADRVEVAVQLPVSYGSNSQRREKEEDVKRWLQEYVITSSSFLSGEAAGTDKSSNKKTFFGKLFVDVEVQKAGGSFFDVLTAGMQVALENVELPEIAVDPLTKRRKVVDNSGTTGTSSSTTKQNLGIRIRRACTLALLVDPVEKEGKHHVAGSGEHKNATTTDETATSPTSEEKLPGAGDVMSGKAVSVDGNNDEEEDVSFQVRVRPTLAQATAADREVVLLYNNFYSSLKAARSAACKNRDVALESICVMPDALCAGALVSAGGAGKRGGPVAKQALSDSAEESSRRDLQTLAVRRALGALGDALEKASVFDIDLMDAL